MGEKGPPGGKGPPGLPGHKGPSGKQGDTVSSLKYFFFLKIKVIGIIFFFCDY
jgi:hypothetical protein